MECAGMNENGSTVSYIWIFGPQSVELFENN